MAAPLEPQFLIETFQPSWNGAEFFPLTVSEEGGFDDVFNKIASSDRAIIEQLGLKTPKFVVTGTLSARRSRTNEVLASYEQVVRAWKDAVKVSGTGTLVHPTLGKIEGLKLRVFNIVENFNGLGSAAISMTFGRSDQGLVPIVEAASISKISEITVAAEDAAQTSIEEEHVVTLANTGNFDAALNKITGPGGAVDAFNSAVEKSSALTSKLQGYQTAISDLQGNITSLVQNPINLADALRNVYSSMRGLTPTLRGSYASMKSLFDFGDNDTPSNITTVGREERERNRTTINNMMQAIALADGMELAGKIEFQTVEEIEEQSALLDGVYEKLANRDDMDSDTIFQLTLLRIELSQLFADQKLIAQRIQIVIVERATPHQISYRYYGNYDNVELIVDLNNLNNGDPISGPIRLLTA